jgi:uncharacterized protein (DUF952 family)
LSRVYKLLDGAAWRAALAAGVFEGAEIDRRDGYIHFSAADQAQETARLYFRGAADLMLLAVEAEALGPALKWEPSRGGALFPHLYGPLPVSAVAEARPLALDRDGVPQLGALA